MIHQSLIYGNKFGNPAMRAVWSESAMVQGWLDVEAALAWAQGELNIIPRRIAAEIVRNCNVRTVTPKAIAAWHGSTGHVIVSLVKSFCDAAPKVGEMFHFGPTTQDILDTGLTLQIRESLRIIVPRLALLEQVIRSKARRYRTTVMAGRSEGQIGSPITFGYKLAVLDSEIADHIVRLSQTSERLMWLTLSGATGVQASFCQIADVATTEKMVKLVAKRLGLAVPSICMHHRTDRFTELGLVLANLLSTLGEFGMEIRDLARTEVAEVAEPWGADRHSSSTMPQKQNPEVSEWLEGLAQLGRGYAMTLLDIRQQHERDTSRVPTELHALPNMLLHTIAAIDAAIFVLKGLKVDKERMRKNTLMNGGLIMSEALMLLLAKRSRRKVWAHQHCHNISMRVATSGSDLASAMSEDPEVAKYLSCDEIREACRPERYVGTAMQQVDRTTAESARHVMGAQKKFRATVFRRPQ